MRGVAIVAIPAQDDYVWKISSEKVPHLTLLMLGESMEDTADIEEYIDHVVDTSLCRFGLSVERRDTLGEEEADVLFFHKYNVKKLEEVRAYLLKNPTIRTAYDSIEQFPKWIPHLTLGYPESPAHEDTRDYPGIHWVNFDTVALWVDDFEGPEWRLDDGYGWDEDQAYMSALGEKAIEHYGIRGMRWGVRRSERQLARAAKASKGASQDYNTASAAALKAKKGGVKALSNAELKTLVDRMNLEQQYARVVPPSRGARITRAGGKFAGEVLVGVGKQQATKLANDQVSRLLANALKK